MVTDPGSRMTPLTSRVAVPSSPTGNERPAVQLPFPDADARHFGDCRDDARARHWRHDDDVQRRVCGAAAASAVSRSRSPRLDLHDENVAPRRVRAIAVVAPADPAPDGVGDLLRG